MPRDHRSRARRHGRHSHSRSRSRSRSRPRPRSHTRSGHESVSSACDDYVVVTREARPHHRRHRLVRKRRKRSRSVILVPAPPPAKSRAAVDEAPVGDRYGSDFVPFNSSLRAHTATRPATYVAYSEGRGAGASESSSSGGSGGASRGARSKDSADAYSHRYGSGSERDIRDEFLSWRQRSAGAPGRSDAREARARATERREASRAQDALERQERTVEPKMARVFRCFDAPDPSKALASTAAADAAAGGAARYGVRRYQALFDESGFLLGVPGDFIYSHAVRTPVATRGLRRVANLNWVLDRASPTSRAGAAWPELHLRLHDEPRCGACAFWAAYRMNAAGRLVAKRSADGLGAGRKLPHDYWLCARCGHRYGQEQRPASSSSSSESSSSPIVVVAPSGVHLRLRARSAKSNTGGSSRSASRRASVSRPLTAHSPKRAAK